MATTLGAVILARRTELGLTQEELANRIGGGVRQAEISRLERGKVGLPRRARLERIASALDLQVGELLARSGWFGADQTLTQAIPRPPRPSASEAPRAAASGLADATTRLREATARSRELRAETETVMARTRSIVDQFWDPSGAANRSRAVATGPSSSLRHSRVSGDGEAVAALLADVNLLLHVNRDRTEA